ncbi:hypothetical protein AJ80_08579 [Polytolypa hystricis UAMH7299]|uniref:Uncharacterized protein n=1 Tax=Polytolypa hystricis (strain UAMH7299) TaxID=1447883 RepID=A0A2B7X5U7_POLH7|nr:hypothetical protein AJ80_08579 [Polytolypa hystricis UAMH7299]
MPPRRALLLTLDAFNTIFHPHPPVATQYLSAARSIPSFLPPSTTTPITPHDISTAFRASYKLQASLYPNYGREVPNFNGPTEWWGNVIRGCFATVTG